MNIPHLQATLRRFAAERDWQPFHTPKNLSMALVVEAAELAQIFQWMTPEESCRAHTDPETGQRIGEEIADVLLYLMQVADHTGVDVEQAVRDKLARNARKHPAKRTIEPAPATDATAPTDTHILLDYENVQPTEAQLRALVPGANRLWVFHGPHQKQIEQRFASFGTGMTPVPISKVGKNALDFHLSFYMGYIASRSQRSKIVVVANDKGYEPMLMHARTLGFAVSRCGYTRAVGKAARTRSSPDASMEATKPVAAKKKAAAKKVAAGKSVKRAATSEPAVAIKAAGKKTGNKTPAAKTSAKKSAARKTKVPAAKQPAPAAGARAGAGAGTTQAAASAPVSKTERVSPDSPAVLKTMTDSLRKMGDKRPAKRASLLRTLGSLLGTTGSGQAAEKVLEHLIARSVVSVGTAGNVTYPHFEKEAGSLAS